MDNQSKQKLKLILFLKSDTANKLFMFKSKFGKMLF